MHTPSHTTYKHHTHPHTTHHILNTIHCHTRHTHHTHPHTFSHHIQRITHTTYKHHTHRVIQVTGSHTHTTHTAFSSERNCTTMLLLYTFLLAWRVTMKVWWTSLVIGLCISRGDFGFVSVNTVVVVLNCCIRV